MKEGWEYKKFRDIMSPAPVVRCGEKEYPVLSITMRNGIVEQGERFSKSIASKDRSNYKVVKNGQLVIAFPIDEGLIYTQDIASEGIMSPAYNVWNVDYNIIDRHFLVAYFHSPFAFAYYKAKLKGTTQRRRSMDRDDLLSMPIPIPPLSLQQSIVSELDMLSGLIAKHEEQLKAYDELAQSIFYDMFGDPVENEKGWEVKKLSQIAPQKEYEGIIPHENGKYWLLNLDMVQSQTGDVIEKRLFDKEEIGNSTITFDATNVLYSKLRPYLNKVVIPDAMGYATSELVPLKPNPNVLNRTFLAYVLRSQQFVRYISLKVQGAKMPRVSMNILRSFPIILPPFSLQTLFAEKIEATERQKERIRQSMAEVKTLFDSRMDYYFN